MSKIDSSPDYSSLFSSLPVKGNNVAGSLAGLSSEHKQIKSGAYGKLTRAYVEKLAKEQKTGTKEKTKKTKAYQSPKAETKKREVKTAEQRKAELKEAQEKMAEARKNNAKSTYTAKGDYTKKPDVKSIFDSLT